MIARNGANKALLGLIVYFAFFFEECIVRWDVGPCRVLEELRTSVVVHMFLQLPEGISRLFNVSPYGGCIQKFPLSVVLMLFRMLTFRFARLWRMFRQAVYSLD